MPSAPAAPLQHGDNAAPGKLAPDNNTHLHVVQRIKVCLLCLTVNAVQVSYEQETHVAHQYIPERDEGMVCMASVPVEYKVMPFHWWLACVSLLCPDSVQLLA